MSPSKKKAKAAVKAKPAKVIAKTAAKPAKKAEAKASAKAAPKAAAKTAAPAKPAKEVKGKKGAANKPAASPTDLLKQEASKVSARLGGGSGKIEVTERRRGAAICREVACELAATTHSYCRMHYIKNWKKIKRKEIILKEKKLNHYIEELVAKYPDKYIEAIRQDLASEKDFAKVISDLEIDEGLDDFVEVENEGADEIVDNIKREFDDDEGGF